MKVIPDAIPKKIIQNRVRIPQEIRWLLNLKNNDFIEFRVETIGTKDYRVYIKKIKKVPVRIITTKKEES